MLNKKKYTINEMFVCGQIYSTKPYFQYILKCALCKDRRFPTVTMLLTHLIEKHPNLERLDENEMIDNSINDNNEESAEDDVDDNDFVQIAKFTAKKKPKNLISIEEEMEREDSEKSNIEMILVPEIENIEFKEEPEDALMEQQVAKEDDLQSAVLEVDNKQTETIEIKDEQEDVEDKIMKAILESQKDIQENEQHKTISKEEPNDFTAFENDDAFQDMENSNDVDNDDDDDEDYYPETKIEEIKLKEAEATDSDDDDDLFNQAEDDVDKDYVLDPMEQDDSSDEEEAESHTDANNAETKKIKRGRKKNAVSFGAFFTYFLINFA